MNVLRINGDRLWQSLMDMAQLGATEKGGVRRLALSDIDREARNLLSSWCQDLQMEIRYDAMGNQFARYPSAQSDAHPILLGSHLDSQPTGGKYDGALGVLTALEVIRTLKEAEVALHHPLELVNWTNEEGARFAPAMIGSGVFAGAFELEMAHNIRDHEGINIKEALMKIDCIGATMDPQPEYHASLELHIEQGPVLESEGISVGVVTGVQGARWYECKVYGQAAHAGTTPMDLRVDPIPITTDLLQDTYRLVLQDAEAKITVGTLHAVPGAINTVPELVTFSVDVRHPNSDKLSGLHAKLEGLIDHYRGRGANIELIEVWYSPPIAFDPACIDAVDLACTDLNLEALRMMSGAGHDSVYINRVVPAGMIFIPCKDGLSHNEAESIKKEDAIAGANVLLHSVLHLDQQPSLLF